MVPSERENLTSRIQYATKLSLCMNDSFKTIGAAILFLSFLFSARLSHAQSLNYNDGDCLYCHGKPEIHQITKEGDIRTLYVDPEEWNQDIHHQGKLSCVDCHKNANPYLHFREGFIDVDCARCHPIEEEEYQKNIHLTFTIITPGKDLPLCYHCHTKHHVLKHDNPSSSVHTSNIAETCGSCHPEVMVEAILKGASLGKISGHRKGDLSDKFDMKVCINCHYEDSAHGAKRVYKDFCTRCHDVRSKGNALMGPTHLNSTRWSELNYTGNGLFLLLIFGSASFLLYKSRRGIKQKITIWSESMKKPAIPEEESKKAKEETGQKEINPEAKDADVSSNSDTQGDHES